MTTETIKLAFIGVALLEGGAMIIILLKTNKIITRLVEPFIKMVDTVTSPTTPQHTSPGGSGATAGQK